MANMCMLVHNAVSVEVTDGGCPGNPATMRMTIKNAEGDELLELTVFGDRGLYCAGIPMYIDGNPAAAARYFPKRAEELI